VRLRTQLSTNIRLSICNNDIIYFVQTIFDFVKEQRTNYRSRTIEIADGYEYSQYLTLRTIELYHNSKFTTGNTDSLKREKPFYNICKFRVNVATRATEIDTKDVTVSSESADGYACSTTSRPSRCLARKPCRYGVPKRPSDMSE
jgi:hypothetical protein